MSKSTKQLTAEFAARVNARLAAEARRAAEAQRITPKATTLPLALGTKPLGGKPQ